jgi:hypothetical protein
MAGGIDWFRWHHGSVTDPKFQLVARKAGASLPDVLAVWAYMLEQASASETRGAFGDIDCEALDCLFAFPDGRTAEVLTAMQARGLVDSGAVVSWDKRQPKRERADDNSTERSRAFREKQRQTEPSNAMQRQETPRGEERREEEIQNNLTVVGTRPAAEAPEQAAVLQSARQKAGPDCPHLEVLAAWAEVLPSMPQHNPAHWRGTRADHLRARWRETATDKEWLSQAEGIAYFRKLFEWIGQSRFLTGRATVTSRDRRPFFIELEWLVCPSNWAKVHEGKYHLDEAA